MKRKGEEERVRCVSVPPRGDRWSAAAAALLLSLQATSRFAVVPAACMWVGSRYGAAAARYGDWRSGPV